MGIQDVMFSIFNSDATVRSFVGDRVEPVRSSEQSDYPRIVVTRVATERFPTLEAAGGAAVVRFQCDIFSRDCDECAEIADAMRKAADGRKRELISDVAVRRVYLVDEDDGYERAADGSDEPIYRHTMDFMVQHKETVPTFT